MKKFFLKKGELSEIANSSFSLKSNPAIKSNIVNDFQQVGGYNQSYNQSYTQSYTEGYSRGTTVIVIGY
jgi:hypothetical protein